MYHTKVQVRKKILQRVINQALTEYQVNFETNPLPWYILSQKHWLCRTWRCWIMWLAVGMALWLPLQVVLPASEWLPLQFFADINFVIDILVSSVTTYFDVCLGKEQTVLTKIVKHYFRTALMFDLVGAIPTKTLSIYRGLQLLKLVKLKNSGLLGNSSPRRISLEFRFLRLTIWLVLGLHWTACGWLCLCAQRQHWEPSYVQYTDFYTLDWVTQYAVGLYSAVSLLIGVEVMPQTPSEIVFCSCGLFFGAVGTAILFGEMALIIKEHRAALTNFEQVLQECHTTMRSLKLKTSLQDKVLDYLLSVQSKISRQVEFQKFEENVAPSLLASVNAALYKDFLVDTKVFSSYPEFTKCLLWNLQSTYFNPESMIFSQDDASDSMYFCQSGTVSIQVKFHSRVQVNVLGPGTYFGELGLVFKRPRTASAQATTYTTLGQISAKVFDDITHHFATLKHGLVENARQYRDPVTCFLRKAMNTVPFLRRISDLQHTALLFSVKKTRWHEGRRLLDFGEDCSQIFILGEGSVSAFFKLWGRRGVESVRTKAYEQVVLYSKRSTVQYAWARSAPEASATVPVAYIPPRSVLMPYNVLLGLPSKIRLEAATDCTCFVLRMHSINKIIRVFSGNLSASVSLVRASFENPRENLKVPILDFYEVAQTSIGLTKRALLKLRHSILKIIHYIRVRRSKTANLSDLVMWLVRIARSRGMSWPRLRHQLQSHSFSKPLKNLIRVMTAKRPNTISRLFNTVAQDSLFEVCMIANKLAQFEQQVSNLDYQNKVFDRNSAEFDALVDGLNVLLRPERSVNLIISEL